MSARNGRKSRTALTYETNIRRGSFLTGDEPGNAEDRGRSEQPLSNVRAGASRPPRFLYPEQIAERARTLWLASGCLPGRDEQNWREAEIQLQAEFFSE